MQSAPAATPTRPPAIVVELTQHKVIKNERGEGQLVDAASVKPGDVIEYRATYTNKSAQVVTGLVGNLPIPEGLEYLPRSAKPGADLVKAAAEDGVFAAEPLLRTLPGGKKEPLPYADYRALRWTLGRLPAGGVTAVSARARVEVAGPAKPAEAPVATSGLPTSAASKPRCPRPAERGPPCLGVRASAPLFLFAHDSPITNLVHELQQKKEKSK